MEPNKEDKILTLEERIDALAQKLAARAFDFMERSAKGEKIPSEEEDMHIQEMKYFKDLERLYKSLKSMGRISSKPSQDDEFNKGFDNAIKNIKGMKNSLGSIVRGSDELKEKE